MQRRFQEERREKLNKVHHDIVMHTSHRLIADHNMTRIREINQLLLQLDVSTRSREALRYVDEVFLALGVDPGAAAKELARESAALQTAGALNNMIGIMPTIYGALGPRSNAAVVSFVWSLLAQLYQPYLGVQIFNAAFYSFDFTRDAGIPGRSRQLEGAATLTSTSQDLVKATQNLRAALTEMEKLPLPPDAAQKLSEALSACEQASQQRYRREVHDDSFDHGRWAQSTLSGLKQILLNLTQYITLAQNKECKGGRYAFYVQMGATAIVQLMQLAAGPLDRMREGRLIMAANISCGPVQTKNDVRDMFRARYVQQMWLVGDGISNRCDDILKKIAQLCNVNYKALKQFDEAGGFNHARFSRPLDEPARLRWDAFKQGCEGPALGGCRGAMEELGQLVVLEELNELLSIEALARAGTLSADQAKTLAQLQAKYQDDGHFETLRDALGLDSLEAAKSLRASPLSDVLATQLRQLQQKYEDRTLLATEDFIDVSREQMLEWGEMARAEGELLTPLELAVRSRLEAKARTSTLNIDCWKMPPAPDSEDEAQEFQVRREKSLTPYEHALLQTLRVRPSNDAAGSLEAGHSVTNHDLAEQKMGMALPVSAQLQELLASLRHHQLDKVLLPFDYTHLTPETTQSIANIFLNEKSRIGNAKDAITTRWNMPGYIVPTLVVQIARATFMGVGGTGFFFLLQSGAGLARWSMRDSFSCKPGEGPNHNSMIFSYAMMGTSTLALGFALLAAWGGPQSVNTARVRREFFTRKEGRPSFIEMFRQHYFYSARRAVTDYAGERLFRGPRIKTQARALITQAHARLDALSGSSPVAAQDAPGVVEQSAISPPTEGANDRSTVPQNDSIWEVV